MRALQLLPRPKRQVRAHLHPKLMRRRKKSQSAVVRAVDVGANLRNQIRQPKKRQTCRPKQRRKKPLLRQLARRVLVLPDKGFEQTKQTTQGAAILLHNIAGLVAARCCCIGVLQ